MSKKKIKKKSSQPIINVARQNRLAEMVRLLKTGHTEGEATDIFLSRDFSSTAILELLAEAKSEITKDFAKDREYIVGQHVKRYDRDIQRLLHYMPRTSNPQKAVELKSNAYLRMIDTMGQKEKLLGYHAKSFNIKVTNEQVITVKEKKKKYNLDVLTLDEKIELLRLISKSKRSEDEQYGIVFNTDAVKTEEVKFVQISSTPKVIDNINQILPIHVDKVPPSRPFVTLQSAQDKLKQALIDQAKKAYKQAGSQDDSLDK